MTIEGANGSAVFRAYVERVLAPTLVPGEEFLSAVAEEADCLVLLDINNVYVSAYNHGFDHLENVQADRVWQFHLAGHLNLGDCIIDTHGESVIDPVLGAGFGGFSACGAV